MDLPSGAGLHAGLLAEPGQGALGALADLGGFRVHALVVAELPVMSVLPGARRAMNRTPGAPSTSDSNGTWRETTMVAVTRS